MITITRTKYPCPCIQAEGAWSGRASHVYEAARLLMLVSVTPVTLADQGRWESLELSRNFRDSFSVPNFIDSSGCERLNEATDVM